MDLLSLSFSLLFTSGILFLIFAFLTRPQYKKNTLMTAGELRYFTALKSAISHRYDICPQVRLASVVQLKGLFLWHQFKPLGAKCVDFVLLDKITGETVLVIELDDKSHLRNVRRRRDYFVDYVLNNAGIPILHERYQQSYDGQLLAKRIQSATVQ